MLDPTACQRAPMPHGCNHADHYSSDPDGRGCNTCGKAW